ncbi:hypothetical protein [Caulifigura coniformis]|nr:hypothetical protein [Caulifigura coniformis]
MSATANLQAYRPVTQFIDSSAYPISEADESSATLGAGIRVNGDDDNGNGRADYLDLLPSAAADNDLVRVDVIGEGTTFVVSWTGSLAVWTSPLKDAAIINGGSVGNGQSLWVEYVSQAHTVGASTQLQLEVSDGASVATDTVVFHSFQSVVLAIAGNTQEPSRFGDPTLGVYTIAGELYRQGYDVQLYAHHEVLKTGKGKVYDDVVSGVLSRNVNSVAIIGYSWGAGAAYNLSNALKKTKTLAPAGYRLTYTASIDGIKHRSISAETRKPVGTAYHDNVYQRRDLLPRGNKVSGAQNLNVTLASWGTHLRHVTIDDHPTVQQLLVDNLTARVIA